MNSTIETNLQQQMNEIREIKNHYEKKFPDAVVSVESYFSFFWKTSLKITLQRPSGTITFFINKKDEI